MRTQGICLGASTVSLVEIAATRDAGGELRMQVEHVIRKTHDGNPRATLREIMAARPLMPTMVTGRKFRKFVNFPSVTEVEAAEKALHHCNLETPPAAVVSAGSETFIVYLLDSSGKIKGVSTGSKCASGTGEFFLQQVRRMGLDMESAVELSRDAEPYRISGRCSVFCKSDCTHALNKGEPIGGIAAGLAEMMARKILELLKRIPRQNIMIVGGVSANARVMSLLREKIHNLIVPGEAMHFEALGAAIVAAERGIPAPESYDSIFVDSEYSFDFLPKLEDFAHLVTFKESIAASARGGERCLLGLDVGSTTTKAVVMREEDDAILASSYLRTLGDPVGASRRCLREVADGLEKPVEIVGLGVTGSGRHIAGLYLQASSIINEILAHATAAVHFDKGVNTIFEIGGQDAKYTFINNGVPCDYAMNEACSAGTGSFLEEASRESLGVPTEEIADYALKGQSPPNFNDQCAAFIGSDIKNAAQEGISCNDILAGLVYSICMNYCNKVKGPRAVGDRIFMQGGVCYNRAVPVAMAGLIGRPIIVPPHPGLMGAFGVALEIKKRLEAGLIEEERFELEELIERPVEYGKEFTCAGGAEKCDRRCLIAMVKVAGKSFPFGGACNRYYDFRHGGEERKKGRDLTRDRNELLFHGFNGAAAPQNAPTVGLNRSFLIHQLYPLYRNFFGALGFDIVLPEKMHDEGVERKGAYFCHPVEAAHGYYMDLLEKSPDVIVLPHVQELHVPNSVSTRRDFQATCQLLQAEPYVLHAAFSDLEVGKTILRPVFNFAKGYLHEEKAFVKLGRQLGKKPKAAREAFRTAVEKQHAFEKELHAEGARFLEELEKHPDEFAVVLFGRSYNAFTPDINMGIPMKFTSRGISVIPIDFLQCDSEPCDEHMHWATGQRILRASHFVRRHPQLYGCYITNFSCGPDSFLQRFFRDIMDTKPSLTLEIDSHTADAGVNTRVEAFLDIIERSRRMEPATPVELAEYRPSFARNVDNAIVVSTSSGEEIPMSDTRVRLVLPSMGELLTQAAGKAFESAGIRTVSLPQPDFEILKRGRASTSCKECLPLILITGMMDEYIENTKSPEEISLFFVPTAEGGCRLGQYRIFLQKFIEKSRFDNVALLSLTNEDGYAGLKETTTLRIFQSIIIADIWDDIRNALEALAQDRTYARELFGEHWSRVLDAIGSDGNIEKTLKEAARALAAVPLKSSFAAAPKVLLAGEIYVRKERFSSGAVVRLLAERGIVVKTAPANEWMLYVDYMIEKGVYESRYDFLRYLRFLATNRYKKMLDTRYRRIMAASNLFDFHRLDIDGIMEYGRRLISIHVGGDPILSCGSAMKDILHSISGVVLMGPFACMQSRTTEAILSEFLTPEKKVELEGERYTLPDGVSGLPFLAIETDGNVFPQLVEAKLESFALQVERINACIGRH